MSMKNEAISNIPDKEIKSFHKNNSGLIFNETKNVLKDFKDKVFPRGCADIDWVLGKILN